MAQTSIANEPRQRVPSYPHDSRANEGPLAPSGRWWPHPPLPFLRSTPCGFATLLPHHRSWPCLRASGHAVRAPLPIQRKVGSLLPWGLSRSAMRVRGLVAKRAHTHTQLACSCMWHDAPLVGHGAACACAALDVDVDVALPAPIHSKLNKLEGHGN